MVDKRLLCGTIFLAICSFVVFAPHLPTASSRSFQHGTTTTLDVAASIKQTLTPLSLLPKPQSSQILQLQSAKKRSASSLVLPLHNRASIPSSIQHRHYKDYKSLTRFRLDRDSLRAKALQARLDLAIYGIRKSDLMPLNENLETEALEGPVVSGTSLGSGEYFSRVGIGRPAKQLYVVLDTGSDVSWIQCQPCADCYHQADPVFNPTSSSSYDPLTCESPQCKALGISECRSDRCLYEVSYGDGSYTVGDFATETVSLDGSSVENVAIGCGHSNEGLFAGAAGLLGLGRGDLSFPAQINTTSFSYCLVDRDSDSASTLEFNSKSDPDAVTVPLLVSSAIKTFYYLHLTGISVSGKLLSLPPATFQLDEIGNGGVIIDSGTAVTRLQADVYEALKEAFTKGTGHLPTASGVALLDMCYDLSGMNKVEVPSVALHFYGGKEVALPAKNYMIAVDDAGTFCLGFAKTTSSLSIIGNVQQQGMRVIFDLANSVVGFALNKC